MFLCCHGDHLFRLHLTKIKLEPCVPRGTSDNAHVLNLITVNLLLNMFWHFKQGGGPGV